MNKKLLAKTIDNEKFFPSVIGFFINHNFLIRKSILASIKNNAHCLNKSLLDFGCGTKPYKSLFSHVEEYIGVDLKIEGREDRQQYVDVFYNGKTIPFEDGRFDSLLCTEVLEHVFNIEELLAEFNRVLKTGGKALITTPFMWEEHEMPYDYARYTTPALEFLYKKHGFKVIKHEKSGNYVQVIFQFILNYFKNILPQNKMLRHLILFPIIFIINASGVVFSFVLPKDQTAYFNNVFVLEKI